MIIFIKVQNISIYPSKTPYIQGNTKRSLIHLMRNLIFRKSC
jgi:hypothetical protein